MEINLETNEELNIIIDDSIKFCIWGERNDEGTLILRTCKGEN